MIVSPLEIEFEIFEEIATEDAFGLMDIVKKEILLKLFEFLFQGIFVNYKMNEYGSNFVENVFKMIIVLIDQKIKAKNNQTLNYNLKKIREVFCLFKSDKNEIERLILIKEEKV